jgi:hypothetical protein
MRSCGPVESITCDSRHRAHRRVPACRKLETLVPGAPLARRVLACQTVRGTPPRGPDPNRPRMSGTATRLRAARPRLGLSSRGRLLSNGGSRHILYGFTEHESVGPVARSQGATVLTSSIRLVSR